MCVEINYGKITKTKYFQAYLLQLNGCRCERSFFKMFRFAEPKLNFSYFPQDFDILFQTIFYLSNSLEKDSVGTPLQSLAESEMYE